MELVSLLGCPQCSRFWCLLLNVSYNWLCWKCLIQWEVMWCLRGASYSYTMKFLASGQCVFFFAPCVLLGSLERAELKRKILCPEKIKACSCFSKWRSECPTMGSYFVSDNDDFCDSEQMVISSKGDIPIQKQNLIYYCAFFFFSDDDQLNGPYIPL